MAKFANSFLVLLSREMFRFKDILQDLSGLLGSNEEEGKFNDVGGEGQLEVNFEFLKLILRLCYIGLYYMLRGNVNNCSPSYTNSFPPIVTSLFIISK